MTGKAKISLLNVDCTLEGHFVNGKLHGPVRGLTSKGKNEKSNANLSQTKYVCMHFILSLFTNDFASIIYLCMYLEDDS